MDKEMYDKLMNEIKTAQILAMLPDSEKAIAWNSIFNIQKKGLEDFVKLMKNSFIGD